MTEEELEIEKKEIQKIVREQTKEFFEKSGLLNRKLQSLNILSSSEKNDGALFLQKLLIGLKSFNHSAIKELYTKVADPMTEGTTTDGGYLVPAITANYILQLIQTYGQARKYMRTVPIPQTNIIKIPKRNAGATVYWVDEAASITTTKPSLDVFTLTAEKLAGLVVLSNELLMDANPDIAKFIVGLIAEAFAVEEDNQMFNGTGTPFTGIYSNSNTFGNEQRTSTINLASLTYNDLCDCLYGIDSNYLTNAAWYMHRTAFSQCRKIKDDNNQPVVISASAGSEPEMLGFPVRLIEKAPTYTGADNDDQPYILLGDLQNTFIGNRSEMSVALLTEATIDGTSLGQNDMSAPRVIERVGFDKGFTSAYSVISTATF